MRTIVQLTAMLLIFTCQQVYSQRAIIGNSKSNHITLKKTASMDLLIPIEFDMVNTTSDTAKGNITVALVNDRFDLINQFSNNELNNIRIINGNQSISINPYQSAKPTNSVYVFIDRVLMINIDKVVFIDIDHTDINGIVRNLTTIKITIQPEEQVLTLTQYLNQPNKLDYVNRVESNANILTINGYKSIIENGQESTLFLKRNVALSKGEVLAVNEWSWIGQKKHWQPVPFSLITIPFKIRPKITTDKNNEFRAVANAGLTNLGFNLDLGKYQMDRYFSTGRKSSHKFSIGFWAAPSVEELDSIHTEGFLAKDVKSKQFFISTGLTISYSYNDISFVIVPAGWDIGTTSTGKSWVYNREYWWGFGIAISPKIFSTILNK